MPNNRTSVTDPVMMFAVRMIGRNIPHTTPTYFIEEAKGWLTDGAEIVRVIVRPLSDQEKKEINEGT